MQSQTVHVNLKILLTKFI